MFKKAVCIMISIILILSFTACDSDGLDITDDGEVIEVKQDVTLSVWIMANSEDSRKDFMDVIRPFTNANPHIKIEPTVLNLNRAFTKITEAGKSGELPDVIQLDTDWVAAISSLDMLADVKEEIDTDIFLDNVLNANRDTLVAVPWFVETRALFYRKDACEKAEVDPQKDFSTWNTFKEALKKLNNIEIDNEELPALGVPGPNDWNVVNNFSWWIYSAGGNFLNIDSSRSAFNSEASLEGIKFYTELAVEGLIDKASLGKNSAEIETTFINGGYATAFLDSSVINKLEKRIDEENEDEENEDEENDEESILTDNIGVAMVPAGPKGRAAFLGGSSLAVSKLSENKETAIELINFLVSKEAQIAYANTTGKMPVSKEAYEDAFFNDHPLRSVFKRQIEYAKPYPSVILWGPIEACLKQGFERIWENVLDEEENAYSFNRTKSIVEETHDLINVVLEAE
ncbi:UNVERIFIED_CONTAM: multiple sugar transport system substrate-binding protein [Acetivibrio alkalicellulosi]